MVQTFAMKRRGLLAAGGLGLLAPAALVGCASAPADKSSSPPASGDAADLALLNRVSWGVDSATLREYARQSRRDYLQAQLHPQANPPLPPSVQAQIDALGLNRQAMPAWVVEMEQRNKAANAITDDAAKKAAQQAYQQDMNHLARDAGTRFLLRALYSTNQLQEQLTWFWFNHFNVHQYKRDLRVMVGDYENLLRERALGKFSDLLIASATHPAMIRYLDNDQNAAGHINENYAREVMELHSLGVDAGYSQKDVQELARVLTGLGTNFSDKEPKLKPALVPLYKHHDGTEFNPARHDMGTKLVLGESVQGQGWDEIMAQLKRLAAHPATARHISHKLAIYFVADQPPPELVERMSRAYLASDGDIAVTLQAMFDSPEFMSSLAHKFKDPTHYVVSAVRLAYDGRPILNSAPMQGWINRLGQGLYNRQTPDGYPMEQAAWASSGQLSTRFEIARSIGSGSAGLFKPDVANAVDVPAFPQLSNALFYAQLSKTLGEGTRKALDAASSAVEWNVLLLSSPEFMYR